MADKPSVHMIQPGAAAILKSPMASAGLTPDNQKLLKSARFSESNASLERMLLQQFVQLADSSDDLPVAALRQPGQSAICADPCYLHPDQTRLRLFAQPLQLSMAEAEALANSLQPVVAEFNATLVIDDAMHWTLISNTPPALQCLAMPDMEGVAIDPQNIFNGDDKAQWLALWNNIQMTLFDHPINQQREASGQLPINSLWFWGLGDCLFDAVQWRSVSGDHCLLASLAQQSQTDYQRDLPALQSLQGGMHLLVNKPLNEDYNSAIEQLNNDLTEFAANLSSGQIAGVSWSIPNHGQYQFTARKWWQLWR